MVAILLLWTVVTIEIMKKMTVLKLVTLLSICDTLEAVSVRDTIIKELVNPKDVKYHDDSVSNYANPNTTLNCILLKFCFSGII